MKMRIIASLMLGALLVQTSKAQISFENFCKSFNNLRSGDTMAEIIRDLDNVRQQLVANGVLPDRNAVGAAQKLCVDPAKYFDPECLYTRRFTKTVSNPDFVQIRQNNLRGIYVDLWLLHPLFRGCLPHLNKDVKSNNAKSRIASGISGNNPQNVVGVFDKKNGRILRKEIKDLCENNAGDSSINDRIFCPSLPDLIKLVDTFETVKFEERTGVKWNAFRLQFLILKYNNPEEFQSIFPNTAEQVTDLITKNLEEIFTYINNERLDQLFELVPLVPGLDVIKSGCETTWKISDNLKKNLCLFWKAIIQFLVYVHSIIAQAKENAKVLNTNIDYPAFLKLTEIDRILEVVQNQETALQSLVQWVEGEVFNTVTERFRGLRTYFRKVEAFNREKANADIGYINGQLERYGNRIGSLSTQLGSKLNEILKLAIAAVALEVAEDTVQIGLAVAVVMNPLEKIFGGSSFGDLGDRLAKLARTLTTVAALVRMTSSFNELKDKTESISSRFDRNAKFLENVRVLVQSVGEKTSSADFEARKQEFLGNYTDYTPQVDKPELTGMITTWENLIDASCDVILGTETFLAQGVVTYVRSTGLCDNTKVLAQEMFETYAEVYDFQFELIETLATYMGALTSLNAASNITGTYEELNRKANQGEDVVNDVKILTLVSFITYKTNIWEIIEAYCDILEYKAAGVRPTVCQGISSNIANLASHVSPVCRNVEANKDIPTKPKLPGDRAFMDISKLYSGRRVAFKIPDGQWLVGHGWINSQDKDSAITVKKFEVFLPTVSETERMARVEARISGPNQYSPVLGGPNYIIAPEKNFIFEYREGRGAQPCRKESEALTNPYSVPGGATLPKICPLNVDENICLELLQKTSLFPSIYAQWHVTVSGYESATVPDPATVPNLKVGVRLCILKPTRAFIETPAKKSLKPFLPRIRMRSKKNPKRIPH